MSRVAPVCTTKARIATVAGTVHISPAAETCRWIGNAAEDGRWATVFARLRIPNEGPKGGYKDHGVHAFVCPLRTPDGAICKGVEIRDCGYKVGLNGVDNGAIAFHAVRVPRENLLDRFAQVCHASGCVAAAERGSVAA